jgi:hypothetical protein
VCPQLAQVVQPSTIRRRIPDDEITIGCPEISLCTKCHNWGATFIAKKDIGKVGWDALRPTHLSEED